MQCVQAEGATRVCVRVVAVVDELRVCVLCDYHRATSRVVQVVRACMARLLCCDESRHAWAGSAARVPHVTGGRCR